MIYNIITDIHEDFLSLKTVLSNIPQDEKVICLGDIVGFCTPYNLNFNKTRSANACVSLLKKRLVKSVLGNHDLNFLEQLPKSSKFNYPENWYELSIMEKEELSKGQVHLYKNELKTHLREINKRYLSELNDIYIENNILFSHYLHPNVTGDSKLKDSYKDVLSHFLFMKRSKTNISFIGHQHVSNAVIINKYGIKKLRPNKIYYPEKETLNLILCPPIVRYKDNGCSHTVYDNEKKHLIWIKNNPTSK